MPSVNWWRQRIRSARAASRARTRSGRPPQPRSAHPNRDHLIQAQQPGQVQRVPGIGLNLVPGRALQLGGGCNLTPHPLRGQRLSKLLLRHGIVYSGGKAWTLAHDTWLLGQPFERVGTLAAFEDAYEAVVLATGRRPLDEKITTIAIDSEFTSVVRRLGCLRGISTLTAFSLAVEIGDWDRFTGASIGAYLGFGPVRALLRRVPLPGRDHQDRQQPRPSAAGRSGVAPPQGLPSHRGAAAPLGGGHPRGPGSWDDPPFRPPGPRPRQFRPAAGGDPAATGCMGSRPRTVAPVPDPRSSWQPPWAVRSPPVAAAAPVSIGTSSRPPAGTSHRH